MKSFGGTQTFVFPRSVVLSTDELTMWVASYGSGEIVVLTRPSTSSDEWSRQANIDYVGWDPYAYAHPTGVAVSRDGRTVWMAESGNDRISVWTRPDASSTTWTQQTTFGSRGDGPDQVRDPAGLAVSADGLAVWVADYANDRVSIWTRPDSNSTAWANRTAFGSTGSGGSQLNGPCDVALSADELTVWVADFANNRISAWSRPNAASADWTNQTTVGRRGTDVNQLRGPAGVAISADGQTLGVVDSLNDRIAIWGLTCPVQDA